MKKRILILMVESGAGHKSSAVAVQESIDALFPGAYEVDIVDFALACGAAGDDLRIKSTWDYLLARPKLARAGYRAVEVFPAFSRAMVRATLPEIFLKGRKFLVEYAPDVIFSTYHIATLVATEAVKRRFLNVPVLGIVTELFAANALWADTDVDTIAVCSEKVRDELIEMGVPAGAISIHGYPISRTFLQLARGAEEIRADLGIGADERVLIATAGGQGIGKLGGYVAEAYRRGVPWCIITVCGKNAALKAELEALIATTPSPTHLIPLGYVSNMNELMHIADVSAIKAGPTTTYESLLMHTPVIFTDWATYNERPNIDFVLENGVGANAETLDEFLSLLSGISEGDLLDGWNRNLGLLRVETGADEIARLVVRQAEAPPIPRRHTLPPPHRHAAHRPKGGPVRGSGARERRKSQIRKRSAGHRQR